MLKESLDNKKFDLLESLAEKWLRIHPKDTETCALIAMAAMNLQQYEKCGESLETIYEMDPSPSLAKEIHNCYQKTGNLGGKRMEWAEELLKMPEFDDDYIFRYDYMTKFYESGNLPKAAEYATLTLKAVNLAEQRDPNMHEQLQKVRRICYHILPAVLFCVLNHAQ